MRSKNCLYFLYEKTLLESSWSFCYFICMFYDCKYRLHLLLFSLIIMTFPACTSEPVGIQHPFEFAWCRAQVSRSGSKDICTLQHGFLCFPLFLYLYFYSLSCIITHVCYFNSLSAFHQIRKNAMKSQCWPILKLFYHYLFQRAPVIYNSISQDNVFLSAICFHPSWN